MSFDPSPLTSNLGQYVQDTLTSLGPIVLIPAGIVVAVALAGIFLSFLGRVRSGRARA